MKIEITVEGTNNTMFDWSVSNFPGRFSFLDRMTNALIVGWDDSLSDVADKHKWSSEDMIRQQTYHDDLKRIVSTGAQEQPL